MENISKEKLEEVLNSCIMETLDKMEKQAKEAKIDNGMAMIAFSLQNSLAIIEYKALVEEKLGIAKEK